MAGVAGVEAAEVVAETRNKRTNLLTGSPPMTNRLVKRGNVVLSPMVAHSLTLEVLQYPSLGRRLKGPKQNRDIILFCRPLMQ